MNKKTLSKPQLKAQIEILNSLKVDYYDTQESLGGNSGDNYVGMTQIQKKIDLINKKLK